MKITLLYLYMYNLLCPCVFYVCYVSSLPMHLVPVILRVFDFSFVYPCPFRVCERIFFICCWHIVNSAYNMKRSSPISVFFFFLYVLFFVYFYLNKFVVLFFFVIVVIIVVVAIVGIRYIAFLYVYLL